MGLSFAENPFFALFLLNYTQCHTRVSRLSSSTNETQWSYFVWAERGWRREHTNKHTHLGYQPHLFGRRYVVSLVFSTRPQIMMQNKNETVRQKSQFLSCHPYSFHFHILRFLNYHHITQTHPHDSSIILSSDSKRVTAATCSPFVQTQTSLKSRRPTGIMFSISLFLIISF